MKNKGFTLIETILTLMVLAGGVMGVLSVYSQNIARANEMEQTLIANELVQEKIEQLLHDKKYRLYPYILAANYPASEDLTAAGYPGFTRTTGILEVNPGDLNSAANNSGYKKITVTVSMTGGQAVSVQTLVTQWAEGS